MQLNLNHYSLLTTDFIQLSSRLFNHRAAGEHRPLVHLQGPYSAGRSNLLHRFPARLIWSSECRASTDDTDESTAI